MSYFISDPMERNYYFEDLIAYTEDNIKVRKICWCDAPTQIQERFFCAYFGQFGRILEVHILRPGNELQIFQSGHVIYAEATDAARALRASDYSVFTVQASDSWEQPDAYGTPEQLTFFQETSLFSILNDDCLRQIVLELGLQDQVRFARTCPRFRAVLERTPARLHSSVDLGEFRNMTAWEMREFFQMFGTRVQDFHGRFETDHMERLAEFIRDYCVNLKSMQVLCSPQIGLYMHTIFSKGYQLEELMLHNSQIADEPLLDLQNLVHLKKLNLSWNLLTGRTLDRLPNSIEVLGLNGCRGLETRYLPGICSNLPNLKELNIQNINTSPKKVFRTMAVENSCPSLEMLRVSAHPWTTYDYVPSLPQLKHLSIYSDVTNDIQFTDRLCINLIGGLVQHKSTQLEQLEMFGFVSVPMRQLGQIARLKGLRVLIMPNTDFPNVWLPTFENLNQLERICFRRSSAIDDMILYLFCLCSKLNYLRLEECTQIDINLVRRIANRVRQEIARNVNQRRLPIELWLSMKDEQINALKLANPGVVAEDIIQIKCTDHQNLRHDTGIELFEQ
ncbi:uncharacterized protein LOC119550698 isoform X2 [Drosophila subpulchrella]|uniref:uncharacterized protein LOC119550698 isoform X2 n=2 Tax=Drosophila subpulchrella TaxID=1486046 RepID=UPI0018A193FB|nr:uncharacterized protein LOC119550698 isoform X2 [Drosophila subpulchrella]